MEEKEFNNILKKLCIFDINAKDIDRYAISIVGLESPPRLIIIENPLEYNNYIEGGKFSNANIICSAWFSIKKFVKLFESKKIEYLLLDAHRIPDVHIIIAAKKCNIKILYIQHGMYIPFMKRTKNLFVTKFIKSLRYLYYAIDVGLEFKTFVLTKKLFDIHMRGKSRNIMSEYDVYPDMSAVFSEYWKEWHYKYYSFPEKSMFIMGSPDFRKYVFTEKLDESYIAYCYQSLVEDGRISKDEMYLFYKSLSHFAKKNNFKIIVKVHPVAYKVILKDLEEKFSFILEYDKVPNTDIVIGHYSSLLPFWGVNKRKVVCIELKNHPVDLSIADWAVVVDDINKIDIKSINHANVQRCKYYFDNPIPKIELQQNFFTKDNNA